MAIIVILLCLALQRYLHLLSSVYRFNWMAPYAAFLKTKIPQAVEANGYVGLAVVVVPILVAVYLIFTLTQNMLGVLGYLVLSVMLLWYCMDARDAERQPYEPQTLDNVFKQSYQFLFAVVFWYFLTGVVGVALYISVSELLKNLSDNSDSVGEQLLSAGQTVKGALDWVPQRLMGLSFALVGNFSVVFKEWFKELLAGLDANNDNILRWGQLALADKAANATPSIGEAVSLLDRTLLLWLVVMAIFTIGFWVGLL